MDEKGTLIGFDLTLYKGEIAILHAPNGWGKSTLFAAICGLIKVDQGEILLEGRSLNGLPTWDRVNKGLGALPSDRHTFSSLQVKDALRLAELQEAPIVLGPLAARVCSSLSGGERQVLALRTAKPDRLSLYDEPFCALDGNHVIDTAGRIGRDATQRAILIMVPASLYS